MNFRKTDELNQDACNILRGNKLLHKYTQLRRGVKRFVNKAIRINQTGEPYTKHHFPEISKHMWQKYNFWLRRYDLMETIGRNAFAYYRIKGFRLKDHWEKVTSNPTGVSISYTPDFSCEDIYQFIRENLGDLDSPALHNIRLHFHHDYLYERIKTRFEERKPWNFSYNENNKSFTISSPLEWESGFNADIILTPKKTVQILIKNTLKPLAYDENGIYSLIIKLGEIRKYLLSYANEIPPVLEWLFVRADFGRDCKRSINRLFPTMEFKDVTGALVRLYAKSWFDGNKRLRLEKIITPNKLMGKMLEELLVV